MPPRIVHHGQRGLRRGSNSSDSICNLSEELVRQRELPVDDFSPRGSSSPSASDESFGCFSQRQSIDSLRLNGTEAEREARRLENLIPQQLPLEVRLGKALAKKSMRAIDWLRTWDSNGDNVVSFEEFKHHVAAMEIEADESELSRVFRGLDENGSGTLELNELRAALKHLQAKNSWPDMQTNSWQGITSY